MNEQKKRILAMLADGKISQQEAMVLLDQIHEEGPVTEPFHDAPRRANAEKMLRVRVIAIEEGQTKPTRVDVNLPLKLARTVGQILKMIPPQARDAMEREGVNIAEIDWEGMIDALAETGGDIVNIAHEDDRTQAFVRVYVE